MKRLYCLLLVVAFIGSLSACSSSSDIAIGDKRLDGFSNLFITEMPQEVVDGTICHNMYIKKSQAILGDPNYVVCFTLSFRDCSALQNHINQLNANYADVVQVDGEKYYIFQGSREELSEYTDSEIFDGLYFVYEIVSVREDRLEVNYIYAYVWDYWHNDYLVSQLEEIFKETIT